MVNVRLFAGMRELAGTSLVELGATTVGGVARSLVERFPQLEPAMASCAVMVNGEQVRDHGHEVRDSDEVAFLPPVSGGFA